MRRQAFEYDPSTERVGTFLDSHRAPVSPIAVVAHEALFDTATIVGYCHVHGFSSVVDKHVHLGRICVPK